MRGNKHLIKINYFGEKLFKLIANRLKLFNYKP
jgi:hypothetical protein